MQINVGNLDRIVRIVIGLICSVSHCGWTHLGVGWDSLESCHSSPAWQAAVLLHRLLGLSAPDAKTRGERPMKLSFGLAESRGSCFLVEAANVRLRLRHGSKVGV